jgi:hypothetical protein
MRKLSIALVLAALGALGGACSPSIDAAAKADVDRRLAALSAGAQNLDKPSGRAPMPMAVGQWLTYKVVSAKGEPSFLTLKLVGQDGSAFWYETSSDSYYGKHATRMLVDFGDRRSPESMTIKAAKLRDSKGRVTEYPENMVGFMNSILRGQLGPIVIDWSGLPQEDVSVPAGRFGACYKGHSEVSFAGFKSSSTAWGHTGVPLSGMVRSQGEKGDTIELVGYGTSGATSDFN